MMTTLGALNPLRYRSYVYDRETGLYYLQSRYYSPSWGRFINADNITDSGDSIKGYNLFVYSANNPANYSDPNGHWIIKDALKSLVKNKIKPALDNFKKRSSGRNGTFSKGVNFGAAAGIAVSAVIGYTYDHNGNIGILLTGAAGGGTPNLAISKFENSTNAPTIYEQRGFSFQTGGSASIAGGSFGYEYSTFKGSDGTVYSGSTAVGGFGTPIPMELHGEGAYTFVFGFNVIEQVDALCICIMEWE